MRQQGAHVCPFVIEIRLVSLHQAVKPIGIHTEKVKVHFLIHCMHLLYMNSVFAISLSCCSGWTFHLLLNCFLDNNSKHNHSSSSSIKTACGTPSLWSDAIPASSYFCYFLLVEYNLIWLPPVVSNNITTVSMSNINAPRICGCCAHSQRRLEVRCQY